MPEMKESMTMEKHELQSLVEHLHEEYLPLAEGEVATYIPELGKADPDDFGICLLTADGRCFEAGDCDTPFTIQSISKPLIFGMAIEEFGHEKVFRHVGIEPSGEAFNSIRLQDESKQPHNPMINAGATPDLAGIRMGEFCPHAAPIGWKSAMGCTGPRNDGIRGSVETCNWGLGTSRLSTSGVRAPISNAGAGFAKLPL